MSGRPSPSRSPTTMLLGPEGVARSGCAERFITPLLLVFRKTVMVLAPAFATTTSGRPSRLRSPTAVATGPVLAGQSLRVRENGPPELLPFVNTPKLLVATDGTRISRLPTPFRSA